MEGETGGVGRGIMVTLPGYHTFLGIIIFTHVWCCCCLPPRRAVGPPLHQVRGRDEVQGREERPRVSGCVAAAVCCAQSLLPTHFPQLAASYLTSASYPLFPTGCFLPDGFLLAVFLAQV